MGKVITHSFDELANFFPKQKLALQASKAYKYLLYGGTKGSGKSRFLRWAAVYWLIKLSKKYREVLSKQRRLLDPSNKEPMRIVGAIFCEDYPALKDRHISKVSAELPSWLGQFHDDHKLYGKCFMLAEEYGGGVIAFRNLDDVSKYESAEFAMILVDELQKDPIGIFNTLRNRLRWPGIPSNELKFIGAAIPGGEAYIVQYWIDRNFPPEEKETEKFFFIQALPGDNPYIDPEYLKTLDSLPPAEREAYMRGDFHAFDNIMDEAGWMKLLTNRQLADAIVDFVQHHGIRVLAVDPAAGGDPSALVERSQLMAEVLFNQKLQDTMQLVPLIAKFNSERKYDYIFVDIVGVGRGVYDRLIELGFTNVIGVNFGAPPQSKKSDAKQFFQKTYSNLKAELFDRAQQWVLKSGGKLYRSTGWNEIPTVKFKITSDRMMEIQSKDVMRKEGIPSPNVADALAMTFMIPDENILTQKQYQAEAQIEEMFGKKSGDGFGFTSGSSTNGPSIPTRLS